MRSRTFNSFSDCYQNLFDYVSKQKGRSVRNLDFSWHSDNQPAWLKSDKSKYPWVNHRLILEYTDWILSADVELSQGLLREIKRNDNVAQRYKQFSLRGQRIDEQIDDVVNELYWTPDSRKAQIAILHPEDQEIREESRRSISTQEYPSNIAIGYYLQNSELHTQVITSSLDLRREFPLEGFLQSVLSLEIAERLSVKTGIISWFSLDISISRV